MQAEVRAVAVGHLAHPAGDLEEPQAEGVELEACRVGGHQPAAEGVQQPEGRGVQQQAEGVGPEAVVAEAVRLERVLEVLDPVLGLPAVDVPVVDGQRLLGAGGDYEAGVGALGQRLGLEDDAAGVRPVG